jgi:hypothetical protein
MQSLLVSGFGPPAAPQRRFNDVLALSVGDWEIVAWNHVGMSVRPALLSTMLLLAVWMLAWRFSGVAPTPPSFTMSPRTHV